MLLDKDKESWNNTIKFNAMKKDYVRKWDVLFGMGKLGDIDVPLTSKILRDPSHKITKHLLYIYSMQSFIYEHLNRACRQKNMESLQFFGAYSAALSYIIYYANKKRKDRLA